MSPGLDWMSPHGDDVTNDEWSQRRCPCLSLDVCADVNDGARRMQHQSVCWLCAPKKG